MNKRIVFLTAVAFALLAVYSLDGELWGEKVILNQSYSGHRIRVVRVVNQWEADAYLYYVTSSEDSVGPYYIARASGASFSLQLINLTDTSFCIANSNRLDDVYCYVDTTGKVYFPSPDCSLTVDEINRILAQQYRPTASLTSLVVSQ